MCEVSPESDRSAALRASEIGDSIPSTLAKGGKITVG